MKQKVAIIGTGISGLTCGHLLNEKYDIQVFEANDYIGGHTATVDVEVDEGKFAIDTGFIVYNDWTYPNFIKLMNKLNIASQPTQMSFSVKNLAENLEYNGHTINTLFAQRRNILRPKFWDLVTDIVKFNKLCKKAISDEKDFSGVSLNDFITENGLGDNFTNNYIFPMCAAIWSSSLESIKAFPMKFFLQFFNNHGLLNITHRPQWYTLIGGSRSYIEPMTRDFADRIHLNKGVARVERTDAGKVLHFINGEPSQTFDQVIFACHSDQALKMLDAPSSKETEVLGDIAYADNEVVLHCDTSVLPKRKLAWASWNYLLTGATGEEQAPAALTYDMNILQCLTAETTFCVTLNATDKIDPSKILRSFNYAHPQFNDKTIAAQKKRGDICGVDGVHFCGAYWYNGFHEDGVKSALDVCERLGASL